MMSRFTIAVGLTTGALAILVLTTLAALAGPVARNESCTNIRLHMKHIEERLECFDIMWTSPAERKARSEAYKAMLDRLTRDRTFIAK